MTNKTILEAQAAVLEELAAYIHQHVNQQWVARYAKDRAKELRAQAQAEAEQPEGEAVTQINGFLCMASSDGDPPITALVPTFTDLQRFIESHWFGEKPSEMAPDNLDWYDRECARIKRDLGSDGECHIDLEDGWVSFRAILYASPQAAAEQPTKEAAQPIKEQASRAGEQKAIADALAEILRAHRLHPYLRVGEYGAIQSAYRFLAEARSRQPEQAAEQPEKEGDPVKEVAVAFWEKYGLGSKLCPSCLQCGKQTQPQDRAIQHMELPDIFICKSCSAHHPDSGEWQKIESAPKDGTHILAADFTPNAVGFGWPNGVHQPLQCIVHWYVSNNPKFTGLYCSTYGGDQKHPMQFTHWRELPPAPKEQQP